MSTLKDIIILAMQPCRGHSSAISLFPTEKIVALTGFGAAAWQTAPRDQFIGWNHDERKRNLNLITNNARFLILPWIKLKNLASKILSLISKQLPDDWEEKYHVRPVLMESFVEQKRFVGTCYKAANWINVGKNQGPWKTGTCWENKCSH